MSKRTAPPTPTWLDTLRAGLDALALNWLAPPPAGTSAADALEACRLLRVSPGSVDPAGNAARAIQARFPHLAARLQDAVRELAPTLLALVSEGTAETDGLVYTAAFGRLVAFTLQSTHPASSSVLDQTLYAGVIDSLPPNHALRTATTDPLLWDVVRSEGPLDGIGSVTMTATGTPVLVLGPADTTTPGHPRPRQWYLLAEALRLTEGIRAAQRQKDAEYLDGLRVERANRMNAFWVSDLGRAELLRREVALARKRGLVPATGPVPDPDLSEGAGGEAELAREQVRAETEAKDREARMKRAEVRALRLMGRYQEAAELAAAHADGAGGSDGR